MKKFYIVFSALLISGLGFGQDSDTQVISGSQPATTISSLADTAGDAVPVFQFEIEDQGSGDGFPTKITSIRLKKGSSSNDADWVNTIEGVTLTNNISGDVTLNSVTVNNTSIDINIDSGNLDIPDGESRVLTVGVYLKSSGIIDNSTLAFFIDNLAGEITVDNINSSLIATPSSNISGSTFTINVVATQLSFITQPQDVTVGEVMPALQVGLTDENENIDLDLLASISITANGTDIFTNSNFVGFALPSNFGGNGIATFDSLIFVTEAVGATLTAQTVEGPFIPGFTYTQFVGGFNSDTFNVTSLTSQNTFTYDGSWSPNNPSDGVNPSTSVDEIVIESGNAILDADVLIYNVLVEPGASLTVNPGVTLTVVDNLTLDSQSNSYSSFIFNGTPTANLGGGGTVVAGDLFYNRFVNSQANGNDLIAPPFENLSWSNFLSLGTNATDLFNDGNTGPTTYLFGPFNQSAESYSLFTSATSTTLGPGTGYRAATYDDTEASGSGTTLTFSGNLRTTPVELSLLFSAGTLFADWNLLGNPYTAHVNLLTLLNYVVDAGEGTKNIDLFAENSGIYAYDGDASDGWDVITIANAGSRLLTPGQGFLVPANANATTILSDKFTFDPSMRIPGNTDDFISGRNAALTFLKLKANTAVKSYNTQFYFNENSTLGLDHGYDGKILGATPNFALYSNAVVDDTQLPLALQSLNLSALENTTIPLGVKSNAGEQITFSITESTLPASIEVYLEDTVTNTFTLLNDSDYVLTPTTNLNGTGRFYLRLGDTALSTTDTTLDDLQIYTDYNAGKVVINGNLTEATSAKVYDIEGRLVNTTQLTASSQTQTIDMSSLSAGVYVVQLANRTQSKTQKVIWR